MESLLGSGYLSKVDTEIERSYHLTTSVAIIPEKMEIGNPPLGMFDIHLTYVFTHVVYCRTSRITFFRRLFAEFHFLNAIHSVWRQVPLGLSLTVESSALTGRLPQTFLHAPLKLEYILSQVGRIPNTRSKYDLHAYFNYVDPLFLSDC